MGNDIDTILQEAQVRSKHSDAVARLNALIYKLDRYVDVEEKRIDEGAVCGEGEITALEKVEDDMEGLRGELLRVQRAVWRTTLIGKWLVSKTSGL